MCVSTGERKCSRMQIVEFETKRNIGDTINTSSTGRVVFAGEWQMWGTMC